MITKSDISIKNITAGGLVFNKKNDVLLIKKKKKWDLPKGKLDNFETLENAAIREVVEETGIDEKYLKLIKPITSTDYFSKKNGKIISKKANWFLMKYYGDDMSLFPDPGESIQEAKWVSFDDLPHFLRNSRKYVSEVITAFDFNYS